MILYLISLVLIIGGIAAVVNAMKGAYQAKLQHNERMHQINTDIVTQDLKS